MTDEELEAAREEIGALREEIRKDLAEDLGGEPVTAADQNPEYPSDGEIVVVTFQQDLERYDPEWPTFEGEWRSKTTLNKNGVNMYAFPPGRLERVDHRAEPPRRE